MKYLKHIQKFFETFTSELSNEEKLFYYHCIGFLSLPVSVEDDMRIRGQFQQKNLSFMKDENAKQSTILDFKNLLDNQPITKRNRAYVESVMHYINWLYNQLKERKVPDMTIKFELGKFKEVAEKSLPKLNFNTVEPTSLGKIAAKEIKNLKN